MRKKSAKMNELGVPLFYEISICICSNMGSGYFSIDWLIIFSWPWRYPGIPAFRTGLLLRIGKTSQSQFFKTAIWKLNIKTSSSTPTCCSICLRSTPNFLSVSYTWTMLNSWILDRYPPVINHDNGKYTIYGWFSHWNLHF